MADMSNVDSEKILSTVNQLDGTNSAMRSQMQKIVSAVETLDKGWISPVKAEFMSRFEKDREAMGEMLEQYAEISEQLKDTANDFDQTENEIMSSVSTLR